MKRVLMVPYWYEI